MKSGEFYSRGKFLLSGEYFVMYGSEALAVPLRFGQRMKAVELPGKKILKWDTFVLDDLWFSAEFDLAGLEIMTTSNPKTAGFVQKMLRAGSALEPGLQKTDGGWYIANYLDFDIRWGLGSSSSLLSNLAWWFEADLYTMFRSVFNGSGFDVFCSRADNAILYRLVGQHPEIRAIEFNPPFRDHLYFVYSGKKQDSQESVVKFRERKHVDPGVLRSVSDLTGRMSKATTTDEFMFLMKSHEEIISGQLALPPVKTEHFPDFTGEIKSLGAWGGDFVMACSHMEENKVKKYFKDKGLNIVFNWDEIVYPSLNLKP